MESYGPNMTTYLNKITISSGCNNSCERELICTLPFAADEEITMAPDGNLFIKDENGDIYLIDTLNCNSTLYYDIPNNVFYNELLGLVSPIQDIFYSVKHNLINGDSLYKIDVINNQMINMGYMPFQCYGDLVLINGDCIYLSTAGGDAKIIKMDLENPMNSIVLYNVPSNLIISSGSIAPSNKCNTILVFEWHIGSIYEINYLEQTFLPICPSNILDPAGATSMQEFVVPDCMPKIDLDCDNSSGADNADFNGMDYTCLSDGVAISDIDNFTNSDDFIGTITISLVGFVPDGAAEMLSLPGGFPGIQITGDGTNNLILTNQGGTTSIDFREALRRVRYSNSAIPATPGVRTIHVQFTTESGSMSNIATAFIEVISLPYVDVDLGPDLQKCDGQTATFNAGNPGAAYVWNTGSHSQSITIGNSGQYIVTVSNGIECPTQDTVELDIIPVIHVALSGGTEICDNEHASMTIITDSPFPLDVEITPDPGSSFTLTGVQGTYPFFDLPWITTTYTITSVTPSQDACVTITNPTQVFYVYPTYVSSTSASICQGDSIWLGYYWEDQAGTYEILFNSEYGCDSTVTFTIDVLPAVSVSTTSTTCLPAEAGIFITHIDNPNGCDTVLTTTVTLLPSDTTHLSLSSCNISNAGVTTQTLTNQAGCDSVIITATSWIPPADT
ncbi:MAG: hypothetical protein ABJC12_13150, partial [Saprospiraceae bacterium]